MEVDLSFRSISELRFDRARASEEEVLVASHVRLLNACNNRIERVVGLGALFNRLAHLDLAHNSLGGRSGPDACAWLDALPSSLCVLNLAHNELCTFVTNEAVEGGSTNRSESCESVALAVETASDGMKVSLGRLRRACPITVALFFNRRRFPHLRKLDLSYNALSLTLDESETVEEMWQEVVERPVALHAFNQEDKAVWLQCTTSAVTVLQLDGNTHLSALNGLLCGMESLTDLCAANCGVSDLTAVSAAATFCPKLHSLDMHGNPVVEAFMHAPQTTIATFLELLLLPLILSDSGVDYQGCNDKEEEFKKRSALQCLVREVAQQHIEEIETLLLRQEHSGCSTLAEVLYAALLQQVIPQVAELDGSVDVNAAREGLMNAAREVFKDVIENIDRSITKRRGAKASRRSMNSQINSSPIGDQKEHRERQAKPIVSDGSINTSQNSLQAQMRGPGSVGWRGREAFSASEDSTDTVRRYERSRSAQSMMKRAATVAAQLRPAVRVTGSASKNTPIISSRKIAPIGACKSAATDTENRTSAYFSKGYESATATISMNASNGSNSGANGNHSSILQHSNPCLHGEGNGDTPNVFRSSTVKAVGTQNDGGSFCEKSGGGGSRFQSAIAALTPMLMQRLRRESLPDLNAVASEPSRFSVDDRDTSTFSTETSNSNTLTAKEKLLQQARSLEEALLASQCRQRGMQEAVSLLKEQLKQDRRLIVDQRREAARLRTELDLLVESNKQTASRVKKRQKEIAYGAAALRRREEAAQRKAALEHIEREEKYLKQAERSLREKLSLSGVCSPAHLTDSSGVVQATAATSGIGKRPPRKTHADLLRENAAKERMAAMRRADLLSYSPRKFRPSDYGLNGGDERSNPWTNSTSVNTQTERRQPLQETKRYSRSVDAGREGKSNYGNTPWRKGESNSSSSSSSSSSSLQSTKSTKRAAQQDEKELRSMYDKGFSPYSAVEKSDGKHDHKGNKYRHKSLQWLSLQQLFEEAAAIQHRQRILNQRMKGVVNDMGNGADTRNGELEEDDMTFKEEVHHGGDDVKMTFEEHTLSTCMGAAQEESIASTPYATTNGPSWSGINSKTQSNGLKTNRNDDDDDDSVDVVVSLAEGQLNGDFFVKTMLPPSPSSFSPVAKKKFTADTNWHTTEPQENYNGEDNSFLPFPGATGEQFSMDARRIYAEILRQRQEQEEQEKKQGSSRYQQRKEEMKTGGVRLEEKEQMKGEESSSVSTGPKEPSSTKTGNVANDEEGAFEENGACGLHMEKEDNPGSATRRALFT
ncbi:hypothetical protein MOQ_004818 [Trypanosoma cruzi marinkellei]|uniref:Leucine-rich repeat protein (LRRP) n=1 Tax=Trypanosoma cruzi marinkellei TaxID=85056 RepID=K2M8H8_TRYCR|nr:hypothetical protein MOQ_004818 [Trypanosoma cruzi marinkellei]